MPLINKKTQKGKSMIKKIGILIVMLSILGFIGYIGYKGTISYIENRYLYGLKKYYVFIEENQHEINNIIMRTEEKEDLEAIFSLLGIYIIIKNIYLEDPNFETIDDIIQWQRDEMKILKTKEYVDTYEAIKTMEKDTEYLMKLTKSYNKF